MKPTPSTEQHDQWIVDNIAEFVARYPGASWGPAHIVLEDDNINSDFIFQCLMDTAHVLVFRSVLCATGKPTENDTMYPDHSLEELGATADFLARMLRSYRNDYEWEPWAHWGNK